MVLFVVGYPSIILQAVCDHEYRFTDCYAGWPGSVHDARVFSNSDLSSRSSNDMFLMFPNDTHLLGDAAYPLSRTLITPYKDNGFLNNTQKRFNYVHSSTRNVIERAFALLKGKFPRAKQINIKKISDIALLSVAMCILHNFCIDEGYPISDDDFILEEEVNNFICIGASRDDAEKKRNLIARELEM